MGLGTEGDAWQPYLFKEKGRWDVRGERDCFPHIIVDTAS